MPHHNRFTAGKGTRYPLCRGLGEPQGPSGRVRKIAPPPGLDPQPVQPVASCYTDWVFLAHAKLADELKMIYETGRWMFREASVSNIYVRNYSYFLWTIFTPKTLQLNHPSFQKTFKTNLHR